MVDGTPMPEDQDGVVYDVQGPINSLLVEGGMSLGTLCDLPLGYRKGLFEEPKSYRYVYAPEMDRLVFVG